MNAWRVLPWAALLALLTLFLGVVGCGPSLTVKPGERDSPTGGTSVLYDEADKETLAYRRYILEADGTLRASGGQKARAKETEHEFDLTPEQIRSILDAVSAANLAAGPPPCEPTPEGKDPIVTTIEVVGPDQNLNYVLNGRCPSLRGLRKAFEAIVTTRHQQHIDALPEAGEQRKPRRYAS